MAPVWRSLVQRDDSSDGGIQMSTGAIVGIACGAGALFLGSLVLFCIYWRRQKRYDAEDNYYPTDDARFTSSMVAPVYTLDYKGNDTIGTTSYANTPQTAHTAHSGFTPLIEMASAMPAHPAYIPRALVRERGTPSTMSPLSGSTSQFSSLHSRQQNHKTEPDDTIVQTFINEPVERRAAAYSPEDASGESRNRYGHQRRPSATTTMPGSISVPMPALSMPHHSSGRRKYSPPRLNLNTQPQQSKYINDMAPAAAPPLMAPSDKVPISAVEISGPLAFPAQAPPPPPPPILELGGPRQQREHHQQYQKEIELQLQLEQQHDQRYNNHPNNNNYYDEYSSGGTGPDSYQNRGGGAPHRGRSFRDRSLSSRGGSSRSRSNRGADRSAGGADRYYHQPSASTNNGGSGRQGQQYQRHRQETHYEEVEIGKDSDDDIW